MIPILSALMALQSSLGVSAVSGVVTSPEGEAIVHAQVFLEPGMSGMVMDTITDEDGRFTFGDIGPGPVGLFAVAPGYGFEGKHLTISVAEQLPETNLVLHPATQIAATILGSDGKPVEGARITRIGVKGNHKVGVPLAKLKLYGYAEPESDATGRIVLENVPEGSLVDLKVGHPRFAQEGVADIAAGSTATQITLYPGVLVEGDVVSRASKAPVAQVAVQFRAALPPYDTAVAQSSLQGKFSVRLKPGVYTYRATGSGLRTPGWERLAISGERRFERMRVAVAGIGRIRGNVRDAVSGKPIPDVRISLTTNGTPAAVVRTGPGGDFMFSAGEGENVVRVDEAPGFFPPASQDIKVSVAEGKVIELPGMWLKPLPGYSATIVDGEGNPVPGALVSVLRPAQFGWYVADGAGKVSLQVTSFPDGGTLLGRAEHPNGDLAALFTLEQHQSDPGIVQLFPTASVSGRVVNGRGRGIGGATVGAFFPGEPAGSAVLLWQTISSDDGSYNWNSVIPGVPQRCAARLGDEGCGETATFNLAPAESKSLGDVEVAGEKAGISLSNQSVDWYAFPVLCGTLPEPESREGRPVLVFYSSADHASAVAASASGLLNVFKDSDLIVAVIANGAVSCPQSEHPVLILRGQTESEATTLLLDRGGHVVLETTGMPPVSAVRRVLAPSKTS